MSADITLLGTYDPQVDTPAILDAYGTLTGTGGRLRLQGSFLTDAIAFPGAAIDVVIEIDGTVEQCGTWTMNVHSHLRGIGHGYKGSFNLASGCGRIITPTTPNTPGILWDNDGSSGSIKRMAFSCQSENAPAIKVLGGSLKLFEDIGIDLNGLWSKGIELDTTFWIRMARIGVVGNPTRGPSVHITFTGGGGEVGIITIKDITMWTHGILVDGNPPPGISGKGGSLFIEDAVLENPYGPLIDFDLTRMDFRDVVLRNVKTADMVMPLPLVRVRHAPNAPAHLMGLEIDGYDNNGQPLLDSDRSIPGLTIKTHADRYGFSSRPVAGLANQQEYRHEVQGRFDADLITVPIAPVVLPYPTLPVTFDPAWWSVFQGTGTVTPGQPAPDGSEKAGLICETSGQDSQAAYVHLFDGTRPVVLGDWFVYGAWMKAATPTNEVWRNWLTLGLGPINPGNIRALFNDTDETVASPDNVNFTYAGSSWMPVVYAAKLTAFTDGTTTSGTMQTGFDIRVVHGCDVYVAFPFLFHLSGVSDADAIRLKRTVKWAPPGYPGGGKIAHMPHWT